MADTLTTRRDDTLLSPEFMHQLERLDVLSRKILTGKLQGERRSKKKGQSVEFADYRSYVMGDDLRFIDWNLYARLDKLFLRLFMEEEDLSVTVAVDVTASMDYGEPNKLLYAKRIAAALGYIGLVNYNRVNLMSFTNTVTDQLPALRGRRPVPRMLEFLERQEPAPAGEDHAGDFANVCKRIALVQRQPGLVIVISDFFDKGELGAALRYLAHNRYDAYAVQLLSPQEIDPVRGELTGDLRLRDVEDGDVAEVSISSELVKRYKATLQAYCEHVRETCVKRGVAYLMSDTSVPFDTVVLKYLRQRGLLG
ncbi:MAG: DUF58 domain-containing protein [Phycisphaeraceae bacterium]